MKVDDLINRRARGAAAQRSLELHGPLLAERRETLIGQARAAYSAGKLDGHGALVFVASLVAIEDLRDELEHAVREGQRAGVALTRG